MLPLLIAPKETNLLVKKINGDFKFVKRLESLGIIVGSNLFVLFEEKSGLVIKVNDSRLALDKDIAKSILVLVND